MKQQLWIAGLTCVCTLIITLIFNTAVDRFSTNQAKVVFGSPITISGAVFAEMQVENWKSKPIDGLILVVPASVLVSSIITSTPISIEEINGYSGSQTLKRLRFNGIPPHRNVRIMIPVSSTKSLDDFSMPNAGQLDLEIIRTDYSQDPILNEYDKIIYISVIYALFVGIMMFIISGWFNSKENKVQKMCDELRAKLEKTLSQLDSLQKELRTATSTAHATHLRLRLYLLARIRDYGRELDFWRKTVSSILLSGGQEKERADALLKSVTANLGTFGTHGVADDFDGVFAAAKMLTNPEGIGEAERPSGCL